VILSCRPRTLTRRSGATKNPCRISGSRGAGSGGTVASRAGHRGLLLLTDGNKHEIEVRRFAALDPARARDYLARLVRDMLTGALGLPASPPDFTPTSCPARPCSARDE